MYLERHIGETIELSLKKRDNWTDLFVQFIDPDSTVLAKLVAVDAAGIWIQDEARIVIVSDDKGNLLEKSELKEEKTIISLFISWNDIETVMVYDNQLFLESKKQFTRLEIDETVDDAM